MLEQVEPALLNAGPVVTADIVVCAVELNVIAYKVG
jgi:hypothetical protein